MKNERFKMFFLWREWKQEKSMKRRQDLDKFNNAAERFLLLVNRYSKYIFSKKEFLAYSYVVYKQL